MKYNYLVFTIIASLLYVSCHKESAIESFNNIEKISEYELIYSDKNDILGDVINIDIIDSIIILKHANDSCYFSLINKNNGKLVSRFGRKGRGPDEYMQIGSGFTFRDSSLVFLDNTKKEINYVLIKDILHNSKNISVKKEPYPYTASFRPFHLNLINDKKIFVGAFSEGRFGILDSLNNIVNCPFDYPYSFEEIEGLNMGVVFQSTLKSNKKHSKFVILTLISDIFEIYKVNDSNIERVYVSLFNSIPTINHRNNRYYIDSHQSISRLLNMAVSDNLIYFSYSTLSYADARDRDKASDVILSFNWEGQKHKKYLLPFSVNNFCVDENYLYGIRCYNDEIRIYQFKML
jgi:hypothetical protein